jgi:uncharacterized membrane protein YhaH (DUF805 family)
MGAFGELFGFEGRVGRQGYLWRMLFVGLGIGALAFAGGVLLSAGVRPMGLGRFESGSRALAFVIAFLAMWSSAALASRRVRDMGFEPVHVVPAYLTLWVVYTLLLHPLIQLRPAMFGLLTACWAMLQVAPMLWLLFWPGRPERERLPPGYEPEQPTAYLNWRGQA